MCKYWHCLSQGVGKLAISLHSSHHIMVVCQMHSTLEACILTKDVYNKITMLAIDLGLHGSWQIIFTVLQFQHCLHCTS